MESLALDAERTLRPVAIGDLDELHALICANREYLTPWMPWAVDAEHDNTETFLRTAREQAADGNGAHFAIVQHGRIVGVVGFHYVNRLQRSTSLGYWLSAGAQGQGTMTLAVTRLVDHAFDVWRLHRVELRAAETNGRSRAIAERLGFVAEGVARDSERFGERYRDLVVYSVLEHEWRGRRGPGGPAAARPGAAPPRGGVSD